MLEELLRKESHLKNLSRSWGYYLGGQYGVFTNRPEFYQTLDNRDAATLATGFAEVDSALKDTEVLTIATNLVDELNFPCEDVFPYVSYPYVFVFECPNLADNTIRLHDILKISEPGSDGETTDYSIPQTNAKTTLPLTGGFKSLLGERERDIEPMIPSDASICSASPRKLLTFFGSTEGTCVNTVYLSIVPPLVYEQPRSFPLVLTGQVPTPRTGVAVAQIARNKLFVHGGKDRNNFFSSSYFLTIRKDSRKWLEERYYGEFNEVLTSPCVPSVAFSLAAASGNKVLLFGGSSKKGPVKQLWKFDLESFLWKAGKPVSVPTLTVPLMYLAKIGPFLVLSLPLRMDPSTKVGGNRSRMPVRWLFDLNLEVSSTQYLDTYQNSMPNANLAIGPVCHHNFLCMVSSEVGFGTLVGGKFYHCQPIPWSSSALHKQLAIAFDNPLLSNAVVRVRNQSIHVHLGLLAARRGEAAQLLASMQHGEVELKCPYAVARAALYFLYTEELAGEAPPGFYRELHTFASAYQMTQLMSLCQIALTQDQPVAYPKYNLYQDYESLLGMAAPEGLDLQRIDSELDSTLEMLLQGDVIVFAAEKIFHCHRVVMSLKSGYFRSLLAVNEDQACELDLSQYSTEAVRSVLKYVYTDTVFFRRDFLTEILSIGAYLQMPGLILEATRQLIPFICEDNVLEVREFAIQRGLSSLRAYSDEFISNHFEAIITQESVSEEVFELEPVPELQEDYLTLDLTQLDEATVNQIIVQKLEANPIPTIHDPPSHPGLSQVAYFDIEEQELTEDLRNFEVIKAKLFEQSNLSTKKSTELQELEDSFEKGNMFDSEFFHLDEN